MALFQAAIRNAEVEKAKAEARLAKLREGGISVDEYIDAFVYTAEQVQGRPLMTYHSNLLLISDIHPSITTNIQLNSVIAITVMVNKLNYTFLIPSDSL